MLCFLGIGSNLGDPRGYVERALWRVADLKCTTLLSRSRLYKTEPVGIDTDRWFVNAVLKVDTSLSPRHLMAQCLDLEREFGRDRSRGHDRELDIDILYYGNCIVWEHDLKIPHPRLAQRAFVLVPWAEVAPELPVRPWNVTVHAMAHNVNRSAVEALA